jgi:multicomponent Na+:H+ antiporter subunit D
MLVNAGAPPFSAWLPDAYPEASWSGTVFLSAFTTKTAVYTLIRGFPGNDILIWIGLFMVFYGIVYALLENDMRRILAYSIVNQVGFMVAGIGIGTEMALNGAAAHAFTHIIYKALLLMSAGAVLVQTGRSKCSELGGLFHSMPLTTVCACIGALAISSFPLTSGFVSKSMVTQAAADGHILWVWLLMTAASAGVFLHAGIKFPWFVFFQKDSGLRPSEPAISMRLAMLILSALCIGMGIWPELLYQLLPFEVNYVPYTAGHVIAQLQLLLFSGLAFFVLLGYLKRTPTITLDTDWFWRKALPCTARWLVQWSGTLIAMFAPLGRWVSSVVGLISSTVGVRSSLSATWSLAAMGLAVVILLIVQLVVVMS